MNIKKSSLEKVIEILATGILVAGCRSEPMKYQPLPLPGEEQMVFVHYGKKGIPDRFIHNGHVVDRDSSEFEDLIIKYDETFKRCK